MPLGYTWEKLHAVMQMLVAEGTLAARLERALVEAAILDKDESAFPDPAVRERWRILVDSLTRGRPRAEWMTTIAAMSADDRDLAAQEWLEIFTAIDRLTVEEDAWRGR
ncbi:MAG: hypothetical protein ABR606_11845 [Vicinamibacterales bacterium]